MNSPLLGTGSLGGRKGTCPARAVEGQRAARLRVMMMNGMIMTETRADGLKFQGLRAARGS